MRVVVREGFYCSPVNFGCDCSFINHRSSQYGNNGLTFSCVLAGVNIPLLTEHDGELPSHPRCVH